MSNEINLKLLEQKLQYNFKDRNLLMKALTHSSADNKSNNEFLEYLGDSLLNFLVAEYLYLNNPNMREGEATQIRARIVSRSPLAIIFDSFNVVSLINIHNVNLKSLSIKLKSDFIEAIIGAMYLDGGIEVARKFVLSVLCTNKTVLANPDYKSRLLEYVAKNKKTVKFDILSTGVQHKQRFYATVFLDGVAMGKGEGNKQIEAEQGASKQALEKIENVHS